MKTLASSRAHLQRYVRVSDIRLPQDVGNIIESFVTHMNYAEVLTEFEPYMHTVRYIDRLNGNCTPCCVQDPLQYHLYIHRGVMSVNRILYMIRGYAKPFPSHQPQTSCLTGTHLTCLA